METGFNAILKALRKEKGMTQEQLADIVGVSPQAVSKWETSSYPDPQLLPSIADTLGVSIDRLYGREEDITINQRIMNHLKNLGDRKKCLYEAFDICRCLILGTMGSTEYLPISNAALNAEDWEQYSQLNLEHGIMQQRLPKNLQYFFMMLEPECGYDGLLKYDEKYAEFYKFLGSPDVLRAMYFIAGKKSTMFFNHKALTAELSISKERASEILNEMNKFGLVWEADLNSGNTSDKIYQCHTNLNFLIFMTFTRTLLNRPTSFNYHSSEADKEFFKHDTYKHENKTS